MQRSEDRILTSHTGALHMPPELKELIYADWKGNGDSQELEQRLRDEVAAVVRKQVDSGIDIVNDGEFSKATWCTYATERITGFEMRQKADEGEVSLELSQSGSKDMADFANFYAEAGMTQMFYLEPGAALDMITEVEFIDPVVTGPLEYKGYDAVQRDIENLKAATAGTDVVDVFMPAVAPGSVTPGITNEYYDDEESLFAGLADALNKEYRAIVDAGFILQVDDAYLSTEWDRRSGEEGWTFEKYRAWARLSVEALNAALEGIPEDRFRYHVCWGSWNGPHSTDVPLADIVDLVLQVKAQTYSLEAANARHEWEYRVWEDVKLPEGKILMPGVIEHSTNVVEHPNTVAERILRFADVVGRENVIAGTDCGFRERIHPQVAWAKLKALGEGAEIASKKLWK